MELDYVDKPLYQRMFGICVKEARETLGLSLRDLSDQTGLTPSRLSKVEGGQTWLRPENRDRIAAALKISEEHLSKLADVARVQFIEDLNRLCFTSAKSEQSEL